MPVGNVNFSAGMAGESALPVAIMRWLAMGADRSGGARPADVESLPGGVERRAPYPSEDAYFRANPKVAGMAAEDNRVILNPYSTLAPHELEAVARNEAVRVMMRTDPSLAPNFGLTPAQEKAFAGYGGSSDIRSTIAARLLTGDPSALEPTEDQRRHVDLLRQKLSSPSSESKPMRDYLGGDVSAAMDMIKALAPAPPPVPVSKPQGAFARGGMVKGKKGCKGAFSAGGKVVGPGDGRSDSVPMPMADGGQAALSDGEYVIPAWAVSAMGNGSSDAGAKILDAKLDELKGEWSAEVDDFSGPKAGGRAKGLGGLFSPGKASAEIELTGAGNVANTTIAGLIKGIGKRQKEGISDTAGFNADQEDYFTRARDFATTDPTGFKAKTDASGRQLQETIGGVDAVNANLAGQYGDLDSQQARIGGAQDYLSGVIAKGGGEDALIDATLADFDNKAAIDTEDRNRQRQMRGAFGARRDVAESTEMADRERQRALTEAQLRTQAVDRKNVAAGQIVNAAGTSGGLTSQAAGLAGTQGQLLANRGNLATAGTNIASTERNAAAGDLDVLRGIGGQQQEQEQKVLDQPYKKINAFNQVLSGAPSTAVQQAGSPSPFQQAIGAAGAIGGIAAPFLKDGGRVRRKKGAFASGGKVKQPEPEVEYERLPDNPDPEKPAFSAEDLARILALPEDQAPPKKFEDGGSVRDRSDGGVYGKAIDRFVANREAEAKAKPAMGLGLDDPMAGALVGGGAPTLGVVDAPAMGGLAGRIAGAPTGPKMMARPDLTGVMVQRAPEFQGAFADGGLVPGDYDGLTLLPRAQPLPLPYDGLSLGAPAVAARGPRIMSPLEALNALPAARPSVPLFPAAIPATDEKGLPAEYFLQAETPGERQMGAFAKKLDEYEAATGSAYPNPLRPVADAVGLNYMGPDEDGAGGRPNAIEMKAMRGRTTPAMPSGSAAAAEMPQAAKPPLVDRVKAIVASGQPAPKARGPMRATAVPTSKPASGDFDTMLADLASKAPIAAAAEPVAGAFKPASGAFMPEVLTRGSEPAAESADARSFGDKLREGFESPLTQFGLALLASDKTNLGQALGEAGLVTSKYVGDRKQQDRQDKREARLESKEDKNLQLAYEKLGLDREQAAAAVARDKAAAANIDIDNARADRALGVTENTAAQNLAIRQQTLAQQQAYQNAQLGLGKQRNALSQRNIDSLIEDRKSGGGAKKDPVQSAQIDALAAARGQALLDGDAEEADRIDGLLAEVLGPPDGAVLGLASDDAELRSGGMVRKAKKKPVMGGAFAKAA